MHFRPAKLLGFALTGLLVAVLLAACHPIQPIQPESVKVQVPLHSTVIDGVGSSTASDPAQAKAEDEFLAVVIAKEQAYYDGDIQGAISYYADNILSVWPETPDVVGKAALAEGMTAYAESNQVIGTLTIKSIWVSGDHAARQAQWEEFVTPKDGGTGEHHIGRCTLNWQKIDGKWQVISEYINYLVPPTPIQ